MTNILLLRIDEMPFDVSAVAHIFSTQSGFRDRRFDEPGGAAVEADYIDSENRRIVNLGENPSRISLSGTSDAALRAALILQTHLKVPLRIFDTKLLVRPDARQLFDRRRAARCDRGSTGELIASPPQGPASIHIMASCRHG
jgi:hypothetical protein